jgi:regulator of sigma E protease
MQDFLSYGRTGIDLLLVILGFGLIIFIHELGHFVAAKWAGIRVLAFAIGFGPAAASYRKGLGFRAGSSEREYRELLKREKEGINPASPARVSPTEYRLNWLPLGGYVKMLGQEDLNPNAVSVEKDSYQNTPVWKRMIVISAGVVMNMILAAALFIAVFMHGLKTEPPIVGAVEPGSPAALAVAQNAFEAGVRDAGLKPGDTVLEVNGTAPREFTDLVMASAMSARNAPVVLRVKRPGVEQPLFFQVKPIASQSTKLLEMGVEPARTARLGTVRNDEERKLFDKVMAMAGLSGVEPGMRLVRAGSDSQIDDAADLEEAVRRSGGAPVPVEFVDDATGTHVTGTLKPRPLLQVGWARMPSGAQAAVQHLLGLTPVMRVEDTGEGAQGLEKNDVFARIGAVEYPSLAQGLAEVHRHKGETIDVTVLRKDGAGVTHRVTLRPKVLRKGEGQIGFMADTTAETDTLVSLPLPLSPTLGGEPAPTAAATLITRPGTRIVAIAGKPVVNFIELREALRDATSARASAGVASASVPVDLELPIAGETVKPPVEHAIWRLDRADLNELNTLEWASPLDAGAFEAKTETLQAEGPLDAVRMGVHKTERVMMSTYLTFERLFEGTVKVEHLKGPVGIAHMGTRIAEKGIPWLLFFMALISVNLAVINFLPLPIVDGGQFIFLILEQIRGKPVSVEVQNIATVLGLVLIGAVFVVVTFHDIAGLFG